MMQSAHRNCIGIYVIGKETYQSFSLDGTQTTEPDWTRMTSLTLAYMSSGVSPCMIAEAQQHTILLNNSAITIYDAEFLQSDFTNYIIPHIMKWIQTISTMSWSPFYALQPVVNLLAPQTRQLCNWALCVPSPVAWNIMLRLHQL